MTPPLHNQVNIFLDSEDMPAMRQVGSARWLELHGSAHDASVLVETVPQARALNSAAQQILREMREEEKAAANLARQQLGGANRTETAQYICTADWGSATASQRCMLLAGHDGLHLDADDYKWGEGVLPTQRWVQIPAGVCDAWCTRPGSRQECTLPAGHDGAHLDASGDEFGDPVPSSMQDKPAEWSCPECGAGLYRVDSGLCVSCDARKSIAARKAMQDPASVLRVIEDAPALRAGDIIGTCAFCGHEGPLKDHQGTRDTVCTDDAACLARGWKGQKLRDLGSVASPNGAVGRAGQPPAELDSIGGRAPFAGLPSVPTFTCGKCGSHGTMPSHPECRRYYAGELRDTAAFRHAREALAAYEDRRGTLTDRPGADEERRPAWQAGYLSQALSSLLAEIDQRAGAGR